MSKRPDEGMLARFRERNFREILSGCKQVGFEGLSSKRFGSLRLVYVREGGSPVGRRAGCVGEDMQSDTDGMDLRNSR